MQCVKGQSDPCATEDGIWSYFCVASLDAGREESVTSQGRCLRSVTELLPGDPFLSASTAQGVAER